jgi:alpha-D-ribose 1-methylphosphonate 5-triphosphate synthase subunit PhnG
MADVIEPLEAAQLARDLADRAEARATVVDFFTVAREHE